MGISFNFKKEKQVKEVSEKFESPVLTQLPKSTEKKSVAKFKLNKALLNILQISGKECSISVGKNDDGNIVLVNTTALETPHQSHVNADNTINNKFLLDILVKFFGIDTSDVTEFSAVYAEEEGFHTAIITGIIVPEAKEEITELERIFEEDHLLDAADESMQEELDAIEIIAEEPAVSNIEEAQCPPPVETANIEDEFIPIDAADEPVGPGNDEISEANLSF